MKYELSPMDYYFYRPNLYTIQFVFEYDGFLEKDHLAKALFKTCDIFGVVKSRIKILSTTQLVLEECPEPLPIATHYLTAPPTEIDLLIDSISNLPDQPLIKFKISYFKGKSYLGISFSHMLGDGHSFLMFLKALSQAGLNQAILDRPCHKRENLFMPFTANTRKDAKAHLFQDTSYVHPRPENPISSRLEKFIFTHQELQAKKSPSFTSNSYLMATLLKKYHRHIPLTDDGKLIVRCPVDYRKLYSRTSTHYFGNAVRDAVTCFNPETFDQLDVTQVAEQIQASVTAITEGSVNQSLQTLEDLRQEHGIDIFNQLGCPGLLVSNVSKFPFYEIDLGIGAPIAIHHASLNPRLAMILPHANGVEVRFKMPEDTRP